MNRTIGRIGAAIAAAMVFLFAVCMLAGFPFGSYLVCMLLSVGYIMTAAAFYTESSKERKAAATAGLAFAVLYAGMILPVYFAQTTSVRLETLSEQASRILDYQRGGLLFYYDLLGYGMMALSTFFIGLTIEEKRKADKWLKRLMQIHGVFFISCFILPMTGMFTGMAEGNASNGGTAALLAWCAYFLPIAILSCKHFHRPQE